MIDVTPRRRWMHAAIATAVALALIAVACESPTPAADERPAATATDEQAATDGATDDQPRYVPRDREPRLVNGDEVSRFLGEEYAAVREEDDRGGSVVAFIFVDENGVASQVRVRDSSGREELDQAALRVARSMRFEPARLDDEPVGVWVLQRIDFRLDE